MHCKGKTKSGEICKNKALIDGFCKVHSPKSTDNVASVSINSKKNQNVPEQVDDSLKKIRSAAKATDILNTQRAAIQHFDSLRGIRDAFKTFDILNTQRAAIQQFDSLRGFRDTLKASDILNTQRAIQQFDSLKGFRETLKASDLLNTQRATMQHFDSLRGARDTLKASDLLNTHRATMQQFDSLKGFRHTLKASGILNTQRATMQQFDSLKGFRDALKASDILNTQRVAMQHIDSLKGIRDSLIFNFPTQKFSDALGATSLWGHFDKLHTKINYLKSTIRSDGIATIIKELQELNVNAGVDEFGIEPVINPNGTLSFSNDTIEFKVLHDAVEKVITNAVKDANYNVVQAIERLISEVKELKEPLLEKVLIQFIFPIVLCLIFSFVNPIADFYVKSSLSNDEKKVVSKVINDVALDSVTSKIMLSQFRYVTADILRVRNGKRTNSQLIGYLYFGNVVEIVEKKKNWTRVKWVDDTGKTSLEGWVFTRYLKKFK